ncbi:hypothetical protein HYS50_02415 [Candidatus Woesearchaeota archaeon]|nr:hypothetical protein [Candidatus Woesearchaeota archaeon]
MLQKQHQTSPFIKYFGNTPEIRLIDFLLRNKEKSFTISELSKHAVVGRTVLSMKLINHFLDAGIIIHQRTIGNAKLFSLNTNDDSVKRLTEIYKVLRRKNDKD